MLEDTRAPHAESDGQVIVASHQHARTGSGRGGTAPGTPKESKNQSVDYRGPPRTGHTGKEKPPLLLMLTWPNLRSPTQVFTGLDSTAVLDQ